MNPGCVGPEKNLSHGICSKLFACISAPASMCRMQVRHARFIMQNGQNSMQNGFATSAAQGSGQLSGQCFGQGPPGVNGGGGAYSLASLLPPAALAQLASSAGIGPADSRGPLPQTSRHGLQSSVWCDPFAV